MDLKKGTEKSLNLQFIIMWGIIYAVGIYVGVQYSAYQALASPIDTTFTILGKTMEGISANPFSLPAMPVNLGTNLLVILSSISMVMIYAYLQEMWKNGHAKKGTEDGTAAWYTEKDPKLTVWNSHYTYSAGAYSLEKPTKDMIFSDTVYMSMDTRQTRRNNNVVVIGGAGTGKSRFFVKPNLALMPLNTSFVCSDPSGELLQDTGHLLESMGYKIKVFNLYEMEKSDKFNPMRYIHTDTDVLILTDVILENTKDANAKGGDDFWEKAQKLMIQSFIYLLWLHGPELGLKQNLLSVVQLMEDCKVSEDSSTTEMNKTDKYFQAIESDGWYFDENGNFQLGKPPRGQANLYKYHEPYGVDISIRQYHKFKSAAGKTLQSILISALSRLSTLDSKEIADLLTEDTINLEQVGMEKTALFAILPQEHDSFNFLAAILYTQLFQTLYFQANALCQGNYMIEDSVGERIKIIKNKHVEEEVVETNEISKAFVIKNGKVIGQGEKETEAEEETKEKKKSILDKIISIFKKETKIKEDEKRQQNDGLTLDEDNGIFIDEDNIVQGKKEYKVLTGEDRVNDDAEDEATRPDDSIGEENDEAKKEAEYFVKRAKHAVMIQRGSKYEIYVPKVVPEEPEKEVKNDEKEEELKAKKGILSAISNLGNNKKKVEEEPPKEEVDITSKYDLTDENVLNEHFELFKTYSEEKVAKSKILAMQNCKITRAGKWLPFHVRFLLDEFANVGRIPYFEQKLATMRKYEISATIILQNIGQIKNIYKDNYGTIIGNCDSLLFLGSNDPETLEYISKYLGETTIIKRNTSISKNGKGSVSYSDSASKRALMTPDELRTMDNDQCIFFLRGIAPFKARKVRYEMMPFYKYTADGNSKNIYILKKKTLSVKRSIAEIEAEANSRKIAESKKLKPDNNARDVLGEAIDAQAANKATPNDLLNLQSTLTNIRSSTYINESVAMRQNMAPNNKEPFSKDENRKDSTIKTLGLCMDKELAEIDSTKYYSLNPDTIADIDGFDESAPLVNQSSSVSYF